MTEWDSYSEEEKQRELAESAGGMLFAFAMIAFWVIVLLILIILAIIK